MMTYVSNNINNNIHNKNVNIKKTKAFDVKINSDLYISQFWLVMYPGGTENWLPGDLSTYVVILIGMIGDPKIKKPGAVFFNSF